MWSVRVILLHPESENHLGTAAIVDGFTMGAVLPVTTGTAGTGVVIRDHPPRTPTRGIGSISGPAAHINIGPGQWTRTRETQGTNQDLRHLMVSIDLRRIGRVEIELLLIRRRGSHHRENDQLAGIEDAAQSNRADGVVTLEKTPMVAI